MQWHWKPIGTRTNFCHSRLKKSAQVNSLKILRCSLKCNNLAEQHFKTNGYRISNNVQRINFSVRSTTRIVHIKQTDLLSDTFVRIRNRNNVNSSKLCPVLSSLSMRPGHQRTGNLFSVDRLRISCRKNVQIWI